MAYKSYHGEYRKIPEYAVNSQNHNKINDGFSNFSVWNFPQETGHPGGIKKNVLYFRREKTFQKNFFTGKFHPEKFFEKSDLDFEKQVALYSKSFKAISRKKSILRRKGCD